MARSAWSNERLLQQMLRQCAEPVLQARHPAAGCELLAEQILSDVLAQCAVGLELGLAEKLVGRGFMGEAPVAPVVIQDVVALVAGQGRLDV